VPTLVLVLKPVVRLKALLSWRTGGQMLPRGFFGEREQCSV